MKLPSVVKKRSATSGTEWLRANASIMGADGARLSEAMGESAAPPELFYNEDHFSPQEEWAYGRAAAEAMCESLMRCVLAAGPHTPSLSFTASLRFSIVLV